MLSLQLVYRPVYQMHPKEKQISLKEEKKCAACRVNICTYPIRKKEKRQITTHHLNYQDSCYYCVTNDKALHQERMLGWIQGMQRNEEAYNRFLQSL